MIYTVTFSPSLDYVIQVDDFQSGKLNRTKNELIFPGGKGINVSIVLRNLGHESTALGFVAGFTGEHIEKLLKEQGISNQFICVEEGFSRINVKMKSDSETEINGQGPIIDQLAVQKLFYKLQDLNENDILVLAGSIPSCLSTSIYQDIMTLLKDKKVRIVVDASKDLLVNVLKMKPFLIKPNHHELGEIFNVSIKTKEQALIYGKKLQDMGARNVMVSMAGDGAVFLGEQGEMYAAEAPKGEVINSVGAGDSMVAGFLSGYMETEDYAYAFGKGICAGSASTFSAELAKKQDVEIYMKAIEVKRLADME